MTITPLLRCVIMMAALLAGNAAHAWDYVYGDGSANVYRMTPRELHYVPVKKENSSSGVYSGGVARTVTESRPHSGTLLAKLEGIENPEQAKLLKGKAVEIPRPEARNGSYYWSDLVGLEVVNEQGEVLGVVARMFSNGAHDVMELAGERERLLPWVPPVVKKVDLQARRIEVAWGADW